MSQSKINSFCLLYRVTRCEQGGQLCIKYSAVKIASWVVQPTLPCFTNGDWYFFLLIHYRIGPIAVDIFLETTTKEETEKPDSIHQPSDFRARKTILVPKILVTGRSRRNCCSTRIVKRTGKFIKSPYIVQYKKYEFEIFTGDHVVSKPTSQIKTGYGRTAKRCGMYFTNHASCPSPSSRCRPPPPSGCRRRRGLPNLGLSKCSGGRRGCLQIQFFRFASFTSSTFHLKFASLTCSRTFSRRRRSSAWASRKLNQSY